MEYQSDSGPRNQPRFGHRYQDGHAGHTALSVDELRKPIRCWSSYHSRTTLPTQMDIIPLVYEAAVEYAETLAARSRNEFGERASVFKVSHATWWHWSSVTPLSLSGYAHTSSHGWLPCQEELCATYNKPSQSGMTAEILLPLVPGRCSFSKVSRRLSWTSTPSCLFYYNTLKGSM